MHDEVDTAGLALQLVRIPSPTGEEAAVLDFLERWAAQHDLGLRSIPVDGARRDLLLHLSPAPRVLLTTHVDTVPGGPAPALDDHLLRGRGACDAKGIAAAMLGALLELRARGRHDVAVLLVVGEETASDGARAAARQLNHVEYLINGEPTELRFVRAQRGGLALELTTQGRACHSGYPEFGHSAVHALLDAIGRLRAEAWPRDPVIGETLLNVGTIAGGQAANVLAERASARLMLRPAVSTEAVLARVRELVGDDVQVLVQTRSEPQRLLVPLGRPECTVGFSSDVAHLRPLGTPLMVGPGSIHVAHTDDEHLRIDELLAARRLYTELCQDLLHGKVSHDAG